MWTVVFPEDIVAERPEASIGRMSFAGAARGLACTLVAGYRAAAEGSVGSVLGAGFIGGRRS